MRQLLFFPFMLLYGLVVAVRNFLYDTKIFRQHEFEVPVISVGNLTAGGTGKTPHAEYLIALLKGQFKVAFLSRGYKRKTKGFILANQESGFLDIGDEPVQIKQKFPDVPVAVCEKRVKGIRKLLDNKDLDLDVIVLDDAFQHRSVKANINILLVDYTRQIFNDQLLPAGRLREPTSARYRANFIIYTKCPVSMKPIDQRVIRNKLNVRPYQDLFFTSIVYGEISPAEKGRTLLNNDMRKYAVLLVTGIANPAPLKEYLQEQVGQIKHLVYPDHHAYSPGDIEEIVKAFDEIEQKEKMIITTEKDLVRLKSVKDRLANFLDKVYYIPIEIRFLERENKLFNNRILNYVRENKSNSVFYKRK